MRVLVADNDKRVRAAINVFFRCEPEVSIVGESTNAPTLLAQAKALRPDLVLLDWELPGNSIASLIRRLKGADNPTKVIVLSGRAESEQVALASGADAFVSKVQAADKLAEALHELFNPHLLGSVKEMH